MRRNGNKSFLVNIWKSKYLNYEERYEDMIDYPVTHTVWKLKPKNISGRKGIRTHDLCDTGAVFCPAELLCHFVLSYWGEGMDGAVVRALAPHQCVSDSILGPRVICGLSLSLVLYSARAPRGFSPGTLVLPSSPQKPIFPNSISILEFKDISERAPWVNKLLYFTLAGHIVSSYYTRRCWRIQVNIWKTTYLNCGERYEDMIDHSSNTRNF